jgi:hypothetical protein
VDFRVRRLAGDIVGGERLRGDDQQHAKEGEFHGEKSSNWEEAN